MYEPIPPPPPAPPEPALEAKRARPRWLVPVAVVAAAGAIVAAFALRSATTSEDAEPPLTRDELAGALEEAFSTTQPPPPLAAAVYSAAVPSLVFIQTEGGGDDSDFGVGSGVVINEAGEILTAHHVVEDATSITVNFSDGSTSSAQIASAEPERDIAVLVADQNPSIIVPAVIGGGVSIGDDTFALGNPLGLTGSISAGVVSALGRTLPVDDDGTVLEDLIQFDAAVNPGSSGGPLLDRNARVVGIVTALVNPDGASEFTGIGFAVPIQQAAGGAGAPAQ